MEKSESSAPAKGPKAVLGKLRFLLAFVLAFLLMDFAASRVFPGAFVEDENVSLNDYETTCVEHGTNSFDRVLFGSSTVISGYREDASESGYVNAGIAYGVITDLRDMLQQGLIEVKSDLVLGIGYLSFYDDFETNPTYPWHRLPLEPYCYFERDRVSQVIKDWASGLVGLPSETPEGVTREKYVCYGQVTPEELEAAIERHKSTYWNQPEEKFQKNLEALQDVVDYCRDAGIRLRVIWMPWNPTVEYPDIAAKVEDSANRILEEAGVETLDLKYAFGPECFYDIGHLSHDVGAYEFVKAVDPWLNS